MWILLFDTASPRPGLGLFSELPGEEPVFLEKSLGTGSAELIPAVLAELLREAGVRLGEIGRVGVISGPGSFTGIRAGLAFARGLSRALSIPLLAVGTFEAAASAIPEPVDAVFVLEAGRGEVHVVQRSSEALPASRIGARAGLFESEGFAGKTIVEIGTFSLVRGAAALVASRDAGACGLSPMYGRPSAAEERFGPPGGAQ